MSSFLFRFILYSLGEKKEEKEFIDSEFESTSSTLKFKTGLQYEKKVTNLKPRDAPFYQWEEQALSWRVAIQIGFCNLKLGIYNYLCAFF